MLTSTTPFLGEFLAAVVRVGGGAGVESAAVNPDQHGDAVARRLRRRPDIQVQAVLAHSGPLVGGAGWTSSLHAGWSELGGLPHAVPFRGGLRARASGDRRPAARRTECRGRPSSPSSAVPCSNPPSTLTGVGVWAAQHAANIAASVATCMRFQKSSDMDLDT